MAKGQSANNMTSNDTLNTLNDLIKLIDSDKINVAGTLLDMKNQLLFKLKEQAVLQKHGGPFNPITIQKNGKPVEVYKTKYKGKDNLGLDCEYVFCTLDNVWIKTDAYETFLRRMLTSLGLSVTNNHAFRMSLNSNVFIPKGLDTGDRAALLGHSIATNLNYYSFSRKDRITELVDILSDNPPDNHDPEPQVTIGHTNVIPFRPRKRALNSGNSKLFTN